MIGFDFKFSRSRQFNEEPLIKLLNLLKAAESQTVTEHRELSERIILEHYDEFLQFI